MSTIVFDTPIESMASSGVASDAAIAEGNMTASITCITPFDPMMSVMITFASSIMTDPSFTATVTSSPWSVVAEVRPITCSASTEPETTW